MNQKNKYSNEEEVEVKKKKNSKRKRNEYNPYFIYIYKESNKRN